MKSSKRLISFLLFFAMSIGFSPFSYAQTDAAAVAPGGTDAGQGDGLGKITPDPAQCNAQMTAPADSSPAGANQALACQNQVIQVNSDCGTYQTNAQKCETEHSAAGYACLGALNTNITSAVAIINGLLSAVSVTSVSSSCSTFGQAMQIARDALTLYSAACGAAMALCSSSCSDAVANVATISKDIVALKTKCAGAQYTNVGPQAIVDAQSSTLSVTGKQNMCKGKYAGLLASGAAGLVSMVTGMMEGSNCDSSSSTTDLSVICSEAAYTNTTQCICYRNPTTAGCADASSASTTGSSFGATTSTTAGTNTSTGLLTSSDGTDASAGSPSSSDGGSGAPPPSGGSGLGGGDAGGTGGGTGTGGATASKINTNLLGGTSGGGGGGGWGSALNAAEEKLKAYMPGGAADPNAGSAAAAQVTGAGGLSNWEKVRARYLDDKTTLLGN